jgi:hypothetical protein
MRVRLITKLADIVDGVDLSRFDEGEIIELSEHDARLLLAEHWAQSVDAVTRVPRRMTDRAIAADDHRPRGSRKAAAPSAPPASDPSQIA